MIRYDTQVILSAELINHQLYRVEKKAETKTFFVSLPTRVFPVGLNALVLTFSSGKVDRHRFEQV